MKCLDLFCSIALCWLWVLLILQEFFLGFNVIRFAVDVVMLAVSLRHAWKRIGNYLSR